MKSSCLKCGKYTKSVDPNISETNNGKTMILSKYPVCDAKKSRFIKKQEAERLLSNLDLKTPLKADSWLGWPRHQSNKPMMVFFHTRLGKIWNDEKRGGHKIVQKWL